MLMNFILVITAWTTPRMIAAAIDHTLLSNSNCYKTASLDGKPMRHLSLDLPCYWTCGYRYDLRCFVVG